MIGYEWCLVHGKYEQTHTAPCARTNLRIGKTWVWDGWQYKLLTPTVPAAPEREGS